MLSAIMEFLTGALEAKTSVSSAAWSRERGVWKNLRVEVNLELVLVLEDIPQKVRSILQSTEA